MSVYSLRKVERTLCPRGVVRNVRCRTGRARARSCEAVIGLTNSRNGTLYPQGLGEQEPRLLPIAPHRTVGDVERLGNLLFGHAGEVTHLDDLHHALIEAGELLECLVDTEDLGLAVRDGVADVSV